MLVLMFMRMFVAFTFGFYGFSRRLILSSDLYLFLLLSFIAEALLELPQVVLPLRFLGFFLDGVRGRWRNWLCANILIFVARVEAGIVTGGTDQPPQHALVRTL